MYAFYIMLLITLKAPHPMKKQFCISLALLLSSLFFSPGTQAAVYQSSWLSLTIDNCTGVATIDMVIYVDVDNEDNDDGWVTGAKLQLKIGTGNYFNIGEMGWDNKEGAYNFVDTNGDDFYYDVESTSAIGSQTVTDEGSVENMEADRPRWIRVQFDLKDGSQGQDISVRIDGEWEGGSGPGVKTDRLDRTPDFTELQVTNQTRCDGVNLEWSVPSGMCSGTDINIYRNGTLITTQEASDESYFDSGAEDYHSYEYRARFLKNMSGSWNNYSSYSSIQTGANKTVPDHPSGFTASDENCDHSVDLSWDYTNGVDNYRLRRNSTLLETFTQNVTVYQDVVATRGLLYPYYIAAENNCGWGDYSPAVIGASPSNPEPPATITATETANSGILVSWPDVALETSYKIERSLLGGGGSSFTNLAEDVNSFTDTSVVNCQTYEYRVYSINHCVPEGMVSTAIARAKLEPELSNTFSSSSMLASKGFYSNRVELTWTVDNNEQALNAYKIYRKELGSTEDSSLIASPNSGSNIAIDYLVDAGKLYQYTIVAETQCDKTTLYSNPATAIGFRSPFGTITGNISYSGGIAVRGAKISASSTSQIFGNSVSLSAADTIKIQHQNSLNPSDELLLEAWLNPGSLDDDFTLFEKPGSYALRFDQDAMQLQFEISHNSGLTDMLALDASGILPDNFSHIAAQLYQDSLMIFLNGNRAASSFVTAGTHIDPSGTALSIGTGFSGILDEIRIWNKAKSPALMQQDFSRLMVGGEPGLVVYLRMNEGTGQYAYDISKNGSSFNRNHALLSGGSSWSGTIPSSSQLSVAAYTDSLGNYSISAPYSGQGEAFMLTPSYLTHNFDPATRALYIGDGSQIHNNIDFEDISSFTVDGSLFYKNTSCAVEGAFILVDGESVIVSGQPARTGPDGLFSVQVPIGNHVMEVSQPGHVYNVGRFPATGSYNFQANLSGISFQDSTLVKVVGRVAGGLREAAKIPGLGKSTNNIGVAELIFTSQTGGGCSTHVLTTDPVTGEYEAAMPPMIYLPAVRVISNPTIDFGVLNVVDLSTALVETTHYDSVFDSSDAFVRMDSVSYHAQLDYIHRVDPKIIVKGPDGIHDFIGDSVYTYINAASSDTARRNLRSDPLRWPVFHQGDADFQYRCLIKVYEEYINLDDNALDSVPCVDGRLLFNNELSHLPNVEISLDDVNTVDELKFLIYTFKPGTPNFLSNSSVAEYSYTNKFEINLETSSGEIIPWTPLAPDQVPFGGDAIYRGILLGSQSNGEQFATTGPEIPEYILRDPPGSASTASREEGSTHSVVRNWKWNAGAEASTEDDIYMGAKFNIGLGVSTATEIENNVTAGFKAEVSGGNSGSMSIKTTNTKTWTTTSSTDLPGAGSDLYMGKAQNVEFGIAEHLTLVPVALSGQVENLGQAFGGYTFARTYGLSMVPTGYDTHFMYNQNHIITYLIPDLENLRNRILETNPKFVSHLDTDNPNYSKNNDDPVFGTAVSTTTPEVGEFADFSGLSYTFTPLTEEDSLSGDSVRFINNQVFHWEEAIRLNEWEKANIGDPDIIDSLETVELDKLWGKYKDAVIAYNILTVANGAGAIVVAYGLIATPVPGTSFAGYATFAVTTATGIAQAELFEEAKRYYALKEQIEDRFAEIKATNYSISGGNEFTSSVSHEAASTYTRSVEYNMSASLKAEVKGKVNNNGVGIQKSLEFKFSNGKEWGTETSDTETVAFTLSDPDQGDYFSVDVFPSMLGWGPIFKTRAGGRTSCPHEDAIYTQYYNPGTEISERTLQREKPVISVSPSILTNVPADAPAVFNLTLGNASESGDKRSYQVKLSQGSNPFGALVSIDGFSPAQTIAIPAGSSINKVLTIEKGAGAVYEYDSLLILIHSECQYAAGTSDNVDIVDSVYVSAHFIPGCTTVELAAPADQWILNNSFLDTLPVVIDDYDINYAGLESFRFDFKASNEATWNGLQTFHRDTAGMDDADLSLISQNTPFTLYDWGVSQLPDGNYDIRVISECTMAENTSLTYSGIIDRTNPHAFGNPSPADGILGPDDEISIKFNEPIDLGSLTTLNFDVRGVLNGTETDHSTSLSFDGVDDYLEVPSGINLQSRDFTIGFSVQRTGMGEQAIVSQGLNASENLYIGFNSSDQFVFRLNGTEIASTRVFGDNNWHHFAVSYSYDRRSVELYVADASMNGILNNGNTSIMESYSGSGKLLFGMDAVGNNHPLAGQLHDLSMWNKSMTLDEFAAGINKILTGNEMGLLYHWRMDEANGIMAQEHVRRRDATLNGPQWHIDPEGSAAWFNGSNQFMDITSGDVIITGEMDFTLEFWFNSVQEAPATLFSNGSGSDLETDSIYSWNIEKDASGLIHIKHHGMDFTATHDNYFDGQWHHFSLVFQRAGNLSCYVDGELQNSVNATAFKQLAGSHMSLGARRYTVSGTQYMEQNYQGGLDEFRFWNSARKQEQLRRDKQNRMSANEPGLCLYLPFEDYETDPSGIPILTPSFAEQVSSSHASSGTLPELNTQTPAIKLQRPVQKLIWPFSVNNDEIILTPVSSQELIENVTLDITVNGVKDLHGNTMQSPVTWIAYVNKNQVKWDQQQIDLEKLKDEPQSFQARILNTGGAMKEFTIENLPGWLTASPSEGAVDPNSYVEVNFTVNPAINIGTYMQDIYVKTDFNFNERLSIHLKVFQEPPVWTVDPGQYQYSMSIIGSLRIGSIISTDENDRIGAFVGEECRGVASLEYNNAYDKYLVFMDVFSNREDTSATEQISYRIWNASEGLVHTEVEPEHSFQSNTIKGTPAEPEIFTALNSCRTDIPLPAGWLWVSFNLQSERNSDLNQFLSTLSPSEGDYIKEVIPFASYTPEKGWSGSLCNSGISLQKRYMVRLKNPDTLVVKGELANPEDYPIDLNYEWNRIGYLPSSNMTISNAFGQHNPEDGDLVKSQEGFAMYDASFHDWIGTLDYMIPGKGYMYYSNNTDPVTFCYPRFGFMKSARIDESVSGPWETDVHKYPSTMNVMARVSVDLQGKSLSSIALGAFVNGECRGFTTAEVYPGSGEVVFFLNIAGEIAGEQVHFRLLNEQSGELLEAETIIDFIPNALLGGKNDLFIINFGPTGFHTPDGMFDEIRVYPNPFSDQTTIEVNLKENESLRMEIYSIRGHKLSELGTVRPGRGSYRVSWDGRGPSNAELPSGIYLLRVSGDTGVRMKRLELIR
jgi:hypothetical protein